MARTSDARDKALATAESLFRSQGFAATGLAQIIAESGAPKGSFYFHFPGGKDQLAAEIIARFAARGVAGIAAAARAAPDDAAGFVDCLCAGAAAEMRASGFALGCALQNIAAERAPDDPVLTPLLRAGFDAWVAAVADHLEQRGAPNPQDLALALIASLEGARSLARTSQSDAAFAAVSQVFRTVLEQAS
ncbi:MAG: TetR/AcrR family transcriptional regulator [Porphyrobacter sp.]|jgi:AcrR family transcriptional regulator|nr:TetR/AcrR family transcriptional regulator [Porphyrobacter sp.]